MRILLGLCGFLLLANLVYFVWHFGQPQPPAEPPPIPAGVERLQLLKERESAGVDVITDEPAAVAQTAADVAKPALARTCRSLGIFEGAAAVAQLPDRLNNAKLPPALRDMEYRVYLPSQTSREAVLEVSRRLADSGVEDYFIVNEPNRHNAISLGVYTQQMGAMRRLEQIARLGFAPAADACFRKAGN